MVEDLLENDVKTVKKLVESADVTRADLAEMVEVEQDTRERDELLDWLRAKHERRDMIEDDDRVQELLGHIEEAYQTAAISEKTYQRAKQANKELLRNN
jgi:hypothetical protein